MIERLAGRHVVLLGIGHTNAHVLRMWKMHAPPDADLTCISDYSVATYSGMLPAVLAGQVPPERMEIDLVRLCASVGARLIVDRVTGADHSARELQFESRPPVAYDVLSIGVGSTAIVDGVTIQGDSLVLIKPMQTFLQRLSQAIESAKARASNDPLRITIVGSGVAGIEITCCLPSHLRSMGLGEYELRLVTRSDQILPELQDSTRRLVTRELQSRGVDVITGRSVQHVSENEIELDDGRNLEADLVIWATGAAPPTILSKLDLALDERGFIATDDRLQSNSSQRVFAVGDTGTIVDEKLPKAGVYAVRQGPILWDNLNRVLDGQPLKSYQPQRSFLKLINLGDGRAVGQWKGFAFSGRWVMKLKDSIDSSFIDKFKVRPMSGEEGEQSMQCRGCGCKLDSVSLAAALQTAPGVTLEDAAAIGGGDCESQLIASTDFFSAPLDDAYLVGRIAALHSASDIITSGATVTDALANIVLPEGDPAAQQRVLRDLLRGAGEEFDALGASIVGGHTIVGPRMEVGFTVIGKPLAQRVLRKGGLREGDVLMLTKPLGIGVLLAAHMRSECRAASFEALISAMLQRQHPLAAIAIETGIDAATDVTGFGLIGHLLEMARSSQVAVTVNLDHVPFLIGSVDAVREGIESSLAPDNRRAESAVVVADAIRQSPEYRLLYDPQTCGGLLLGVAADRTEELTGRMMESGLPKPAAIGRVDGHCTESKCITVL